MRAPAQPGFDPQAAAALLRALAHPMRLQILFRLLEGEVAVSGFETELGLKQPSLSQQLALLREAALVSTRRESKSVVYRLADGRVPVMLATLQAMQGGHEPRREAAAARAEAPPSGKPRRAPRPSGPAPCGMFAVAGWDAVPQPGRP